MQLFVIGNGFDIAHGLSTRYTDFRSYIEGKSWSFLSRFEELYGFYSDGDKNPAEDYLWIDFENNLSEIREEILVDSGTSIELDLESGDVGILDTLDAYWEQEYGFIEELQNYLYEWVSNINIVVDRKTQLIKEDCDDLYLTFNYTSVLEDVYRVDSGRILHIHGSLNELDDRPIIGHGNSEKIKNMKRLAIEAANKFYEKEESIYRAISNYYTRTLKDVSPIIAFNRHFFQKLSKVTRIHIIGTSLGGVDMPYFNEIKESTEENTIWNIYCYYPQDMSIFVEKIKSLGVNEENIIALDTSKFFNLKKP